MSNGFEKGRRQQPDCELQRLREHKILITKTKDGGTMMNSLAKFALLAGCFTFVGTTLALAQEQPSHEHSMHEHEPRLAQIVALDECDPTTFNAALGPDFCKNVALAALGYATNLSDLFSMAAAGTPDRGWDFEPDILKVREGTDVSVVDQGGEPHTFTEVAKFGGGFIPGLNAGEEVVPECSGGFKNVAVAKTRILQASTLEITGLSKGEHKFQCCIHPWMRVKVEVK
jgi:plastocyanin